MEPKGFNDPNYPLGASSNGPPLLAR